jgi:hypothetical protein
MLHERRATGYRYDQASDRIVLAVGTSVGGAKSRSATVLLSGGGALVGVDLRDGDPTGFVVMWGAHEDVKEQRSARVEVRTDGDGAPAEVVVIGAKDLVRDVGVTPYG